MQKRNREKEYFNNFQTLSPIKSAGLNHFTPILYRESPSIQRYFIFSSEEKMFTPTQNALYGYNRFNFLNINNSLNKPVKTPQEINKENI